MVAMTMRSALAALAAIVVMAATLMGILWFVWHFSGRDGNPAFIGGFRSRQGACARNSKVDFSVADAIIVVVDHKVSSVLVKTLHDVFVLNVELARERARRRRGEARRNQDLLTERELNLVMGVCINC